MDKTFKEYRNRVVERFGAEVDKELRYNIKAKKFEETVTDPDSGKEKKVKSTVDVAAPSTNDYARFFDDTCEAYESNMDYNLKYYGVDMEYIGTIFTELRDKTISDNSSFYENSTIEETVDYLESDWELWLFWVIWIIVIGLCVFGFYYIDNEWIEN